MTLEKNKEKVETKGQKMGSKDSSRLIRNYKKREDAIKQGIQLFEEFRGVFLSCVQNRFATGNPVVRNYVERKLHFFAGMAKLYQQLYDQKEILNMQDDIDAYKDRLFQSRIGDISGINSSDINNQSNIFNSNLISGEGLSNNEMIKPAEPKKQEAAFRNSQTLDFKRKPTEIITKNEPRDFDQISSIQNSDVAKEDEKKKFMDDDDPFNFDAFSTVKKPDLMNQSANKLQQQKSPMINFKNKVGTFKTQEYKDKDITDLLSVPKDDMANSNKSKFDFDFGSFQPVHRQNITQPVHHEMAEPSHVPIAHEFNQHIPQSVYDNMHTYATNQPHSQPHSQQGSLNPSPRKHVQFNDQHQTQTFAHEYNNNDLSSYNNNIDNTEQEIQNIKQPLYGQFDQTENENYQQLHQDENINNNEQQDTYHNNAQHIAPTYNKDQQYPIHIDKNASSDEEYTYY